MQQKVKQSLKLVNYSGIAAVGLVLAATLLLGVIPMKRSGRADNNATAELRDGIVRFDDLRLANARADVQIRDAESRLLEAEKGLASGPPDAAFNNELTAVAKASGIRIENMPPVSAPKKAGPYTTVQITVIGSGDWNNCYKFLAGLRAMKQIARLDFAVIDVDNKDDKSRTSNQLNCQLTVKFSTFYMER